MAIPITVRCECGETHSAKLGDVVECSCGRRYDTSQIPESTFAQVREHQAKARLYVRVGADLHHRRRGRLVLPLGHLGRGDHCAARRLLWFWYIRRWFMRKFVPSPGRAAHARAGGLAANDAGDARPTGAARGGPVARSVSPVMLLTLNVELEEPAIAFAIDTAAQTGAELYICDAIPLEYRNYVGHVARQYAEQMNRKHLDAVARRARELGRHDDSARLPQPEAGQDALEVARDGADRPARLRREPEGARQALLPQGREANPRQTRPAWSGSTSSRTRNRCGLQACHGRCENAGSRCCS